MTNPRPIHKLHRDLISEPDKAEPSYSYEEKSFMGRDEDDIADEYDFHKRTRQSSGSHGAAVPPNGSFWRSDAVNKGPAGSSQTSPTFSSMQMSEPQRLKARSLTTASAGHLNGGTGLLEASLNSQKGEPYEAQGQSGNWAGRHRTVSAPSSAQAAAKRDKINSTKQRKEARRHKMETQHSQEFEVGHLPEETTLERNITVGSNGEVNGVGAGDASVGSDGSILFGKSTNGSVLLGKSSSLIFPTGVEPTSTAASSESVNSKRRNINLLLDQCEAVRFPFKKKLILANLHLNASDIPIKDLCGTPLGQSLHKLSLAGNRLGYVPGKLVQNLPMLKHMDLSQCDLHHLPEKWNLPNLRRLNLSHNRLTEFPEEGMLGGIPELQELDMYGNKVAEIIIPSNPKLLAKLETLNLGYNDLNHLPDELDGLKALRTLKVMNNFLGLIPMRVCDMDLKWIDVSSNPLFQPPVETCERGIHSMKRYYRCLRIEEQSKSKGGSSSKRAPAKRKTSYGFITQKFMLPTMNSSAAKTDRKMSDESNRSTLTMKSDFLVSGNDRKQKAVLQSDGSLPKPTVERSSSAPTQVPSVAAKKEEEASSAVPENVDVNVDVNEGPVSAAIQESQSSDEVAVNDTLKVIFVGMAMVGKTSMIKRLMEGYDAVIPTHDQRTIGVDIYEWDPKEDKRFEHIDSRIEMEDKELADAVGDVNVKFSVWDFAGQHVYHATHELFFSNRALYVLVWDMGATNRATLKRKNSRAAEHGAFKLSYDSSDEESDENDEFSLDREYRRADRALERDIDEKVQFWVDCIQSSAPGAAILPVASFDDHFSEGEGGVEEAQRRCNVMKQRLLRHEERRIQGIKERLKEYHDQNRAHEEGATRLRKLLCSYTRPKLIFGDDENSVVRVSGTAYTGFDTLTKKILDIATGRDKNQWNYPIFRGHIGARIPRMRAEVREAVREMRDRFKVVEWGYFLTKLRELGLTDAEDISDALHFLTNVGELSYFGGVMDKDETKMRAQESNDDNGSVHEDAKDARSDDADSKSDDEDFLNAEEILSMDNTTSMTMPMTDEGSLSTTDWKTNGLSQFVFLNPRWLVAAVACILRHDLDREIQETKRLLNVEEGSQSLASNFYEAQMNCPIITADDACMLWQAKKITKKAADRAQAYSNNLTLTPFEFLQILLIRFGVFVPIDLSIGKAFLGGKNYGRQISDNDVTGTEISIQSSETQSSLQAQFFFLPSLLGPGEPSEAWTYKTSDSWKTTLAHSMLFPDGVPPGLMERITASVLSNVYAVAHRGENKTHDNILGNLMPSFQGRLNVKEVLCWRTAFYLKLGVVAASSGGDQKESVVEIFAHLVDRESHLCVGSDYMGIGMRRLIVSAKGQVGDYGRKIWNGGYLVVMKSLKGVMEEYGGLEFQKQAFCPDCLAKSSLGATCSWDVTVLRAAVANGDDKVRCKFGHRVDTQLIAGPLADAYPSQVKPKKSIAPRNEEVRDDPVVPVVPVNDLLRAVVVVGLWNGKTRKIVRVGSGFVADRKRGLIVTASHTLMNIWGDKNSPFGEDYYGLRQGKVVIGVIPRKKESRGDGANDGAETQAVFRYFANIVAKDPNIEKGVCQLDACVLRITTRMENDVGGDGEGCGDQPEILLLNNPEALKREKLQQLKSAERVELDEQVRILGYNQGGEGLLGPGESLNRYVDFARGYVCKLFSGNVDEADVERHRFKPKAEIVVICPTIGGHSGGPCVNQQGDVIGILSRADPAESQRCYLVPAHEWKDLLKRAKQKL